MSIELIHIYNVSLIIDIFLVGILLSTTSKAVKSECL